MIKAALIQICASDQPQENLVETAKLIKQAAKGGAEFVLTPEVTNCVSDSKSHQNSVLHHQKDDPTLAALQAEAKAADIWLLIGSLALKTEDADGRFANRSFLINPEGEIAAQYDKIHMFDVNLSDTESYRESHGYRPGQDAVVAEAPFGKIGMTVCYDIRFPHLHRQLAQSGAEILTVPAAFARPTGQAHWEVLLRARAIETGCFVLAPAQTGEHDGSARKTHGHSLAVSPWGEVLVDAGTEPGVTYVDLDMSQVVKARQRVPSLSHDRDFKIRQ